MARPRLNRPLVLEGAVRLPDGAGGVTEVWEARGTLWAEVSARTGREAEAEGVAVARAGYRITVRAAPQGAASRPEAGQRLRDGARIFAILSVTEADGAGRYLSLWAQEEVVP
ncbi:head-tail adaptor protein [Roseovarius sp. 217]|jgi:head-tail adaptor|uniref:head-tail adaptor protein n=3 Tax=unclassified Roseovarius TaxID=2614913 RepID=UPI00006874EE|nr:head-tail adaptor protein [Roseovarius sp. 217]EAQ25121.1 head-tail adaptor, putative [Roseovarius sp. 217]